MRELDLILLRVSSSVGFQKYSSWSWVILLPLPSFYFEKIARKVISIEKRKGEQFECISMSNKLLRFFFFFFASNGFLAPFFTFEAKLKLKGSNSLTSKFIVSFSSV